MDTVRIVGNYSEWCFCEGRRRPLAPVPRVPYRPFRFAQAARAFAEKNRLRFGGFNKDKSAWAVDPVPCAHRSEQRVRIDWELGVFLTLDIRR